MTRQPRQPRQPRTKRDRQRGIALIAVSAAIAFVAITTTEFSYTTNVDYLSATNARDQMRAEFLSVAGMNISRLVIKVQHDLLDKNRKYIGDTQLADYLPMMMGAFGGGKEEVAALTELLGVPPGSQGDVKGLGLPEGEFDVEVTTDDGKINVNCAAGGGPKLEMVRNMLTALVAAPAYDPLFQNRDGDGQYTDRQMFVKAIIDYIDPDEAGDKGTEGASGGAEDYGYESLKSPYRAKNRYLDSVDELQLVRGMDDRKWDMFGGAFTTHGGCQINLGAVQDLNVIAAILRYAAKDPNEAILQDYPKLLGLAAMIAQARTMGLTFEKTKDFVEFVNDPAGAVMGASETGAAGAAGAIKGIALDQKKLDQVARVGGRNSYRVVSTAKMGRVETRIVGVWENFDRPNQNNRDPAYVKAGTSTYWRQD